MHAYHADASECLFSAAIKMKKKGKAGHRKGRSGASRAPHAPTFVDGRHHDVATAGAHEEVVRLARDFRGMSGQTLLTLSLGTCQQLIGAVCPLQFKFSSEPDILPADRAGHVAILRSAHAIRTKHLAWVSQTVNQLVAVEHALAQQVQASVNDLEAHDATDADVCAGCSFTEANFEADSLSRDAAHARFRSAVGAAIVRRH